MRRERRGMLVNYGLARRWVAGLLTVSLGVRGRWADDVEPTARGLGAGGRAVGERGRARPRRGPPRRPPRACQWRWRPPRPRGRRRRRAGR